MQLQGCGVRTFLPSTSLARNGPAITRLTRQKNYTICGIAVSYFVETSFSNCVSSKVGTPKDCAFASFEPASEPTIT